MTDISQLTSRLEEFNRSGPLMRQDEWKAGIERIMREFIEQKTKISGKKD